MKPTEREIALEIQEAYPHLRRAIVQFTKPQRMETFRRRGWAWRDAEEWLGVDIRKAVYDHLVDNHPALADMKTVGVLVKHMKMMVPDSRESVEVDLAGNATTPMGHEYICE